MARVYVSSTVVDLEKEREEVMRWLVSAGHLPVHSYVPNTETVRQSCLEDVAGCDLYVLLLGYRYGFQPADGNPENLSITQLEFRRAADIPRIALISTSIPNVSNSDIRNPDRLKLVQGFWDEVARLVRPAEFHDMASLISGLSTGVMAALSKLAPPPAAVGPDDPRVLEIVATLAGEIARTTRQLDESVAENQRLAALNRELEDKLREAIARTLNAAEQPGAAPAVAAAVEALEKGDTRPAEALLRVEERDQAAGMDAAGVGGEQSRSEAASLAREQGALALGRDAHAALEAFQRAAEYEPDDVWNHFYIGDLQMLLGDTVAAQRSFERGKFLAQERVARDPANTEWQRDLSVSHDRIGDVLAAQGDGPGALAAYRKGLEIAQALAARDRANAQWQTDVAVSCAKLGSLEQGQSLDERRGYLIRGRAILSQLKGGGRLLPEYDWIPWFDAEIAKLGPGGR